MVSSSSLILKMSQHFFHRLIRAGLGIGYLLLIAAAIAFASPQKKNDQALLHCLNLHPAKYCHLTHGNQS
jgi:hypothetical protein